MHRDSLNRGSALPGNHSGAFERVIPVHSRTELHTIETSWLPFAPVQHLSIHCIETDYLPCLVVPSVKVYNAIYKKLISRLDFADVSSFISMEVLKFTTTVPLAFRVRLPVARGKAAWMHKCIPEPAGVHVR